MSMQNGNGTVLAYGKKQAGPLSINPLLQDTNGILLVNNIGTGGGGTSSTFGDPFPVTGTAVGAETPGGNMAGLQLDNSGNLKVDVAAGSLTVAPVTSVTVSAGGPTAVGTSSSQALAANANRKRLSLQNTGTTNIYVLLGAGTASVSNYHFILAMGGNLNDGSSRQYLDTMWLGAVQWASSGVGGQAVAFENT